MSNEIWKSGNLKGFTEFPLVFPNTKKEDKSGNVHFMKILNSDQQSKTKRMHHLI